MKKSAVSGSFSSCLNFLQKIPPPPNTATATATILNFRQPENGCLLILLLFPKATPAAPVKQTPAATPKIETQQKERDFNAKKFRLPNFRLPEFFANNYWLSQPSIFKRYSIAGRETSNNSANLFKSIIFFF